MDRVKRWFSDHRLPYTDGMEQKLSHFGVEILEDLKLLSEECWDEIWTGVAMPYITKERFRRSLKELNEEEYDTTAQAPIPLASESTPMAQNKPASSFKPRAKAKAGATDSGKLFQWFGAPVKKTSALTKRKAGTNRPDVFSDDENE